MTTELQATLSVILQQLANFFGMSVETIAANAPEWLEKYGWYAVWGYIPWFLIIGALIGIFIVGATLAFADDCDFPTGLIILLIILEIVIIMFSCVGIPLIRCGMAPEFYGLNALLKAIK